MVDVARERASSKRAGREKRVNNSSAFDLDEIPDVSSGRYRDLVTLDGALSGLSVEQTAEVLQISPQSVMRDWKLAKAWLTRELAKQPHGR